MNKTELVAAVAEATDMSKAEAAEAVDATFNAITKAMQAGDEVRIIGFGNFVVSYRPAAVRRNPSTQEPMEIPAMMVPKFKPGKMLKEAVKKAPKKKAA